MSGIMNRTARQFNIKVMGAKNRKIKVFLKPGFNIVDDEIWTICANDKFVKGLKKDQQIQFGTKDMEEMEMEFMDQGDKHAKVTEVQIPVKKEDKESEE